MTSQSRVYFAFVEHLCKHAQYYISETLLRDPLLKSKLKSEKNKLYNDKDKLSHKKINNQTSNRQSSSRSLHNTPHIQAITFN